MVFADFASLIRFNTHTDATTFPDTQILLLSNIWRDQMAKEILAANEYYFGNPISVNLVANQREYVLDPTCMGQIQMVEAMIDGINWKRLKSVNWELNNSTTDENGIETFFLSRPWSYTIFNKAIWLLTGPPIIAVSGGLKIWYYTWPAAFTDLSLTTEMDLSASDAVHGWPRQFQELLARKVQIAYKTSRDKPVTLSESEQMFAMDFAKAISSIQDQSIDGSVLATTPYNSGSDY